MSTQQPVVAVHGGAGHLPEAERPRHVEGCKHAAEAALALLEQGASALDAVERAVGILEDDPCFNAGTGAALTSEATLELDACIMEGTGRRAGGVAALPPFPHPVQIARAVLEDGRHVLYAARGAAAFAEEAGFAPAALDAMRTVKALQRLQERAKASPHGAPWTGDTVGAVARDPAGRLAAATSTGGTMGKLPGRIGDTPIVGAGTYADDGAAACSATGLGETIMRACLSYAAADAIARGAAAPDAASRTIEAFRNRVEGLGGLLLLAPDGTPGIAWNTETMTWAIARPGRATDAGC